MAFKTNDLTRMNIDSSGAVLIGNIPKIDTATKLQVSGSDSGVSTIWSNADDVVIENDNSVGITLATPNTGNASIGFADPEAVNAGYIQYYHPENWLRFGTQAIERLRIDSSGNVGIGVTPEAWTGYAPVLQIGDRGSIAHWANDSISIGDNWYYASGNKRIEAGYAPRIQLASATGKIYFDIADTDAADSAITWSTKMIILPNGNVGIGTTNPSRNLTIGDGSGNSVLAIVAATNGLSQIGLGDSDDDNYGQIILRHSDGLLQIQNGGGGGISERGLNITSSEDIGIGTTSPAEKLQVSGGNILLKSSNNGGGNANNRLILFDSDTTASAGQGIGSIAFYGSDASGAGAGIKCWIKAFYASDGDSSIMTFSTSDSTTNNIERLRINTNGAIGIGGTNYGTSGQVLTSNGNAAPSWQAGGGGGGASSLNGLSDCLVATTSLAVGTVPSNLSSSSVSNTILGLSAGSSLAVSKQNTIIGENAASNAVGIEEGNVYTNLSNNAQNHTAGTYTLSVAGQFPWDPSNDFTITINSSGIFSAVTDASNPPYQTVGTVTVPTSLIGGSSAETFTSTYLSNAKFENNVILGHDAWNTGTLGQDLVVIGTNAAYSAGTGTSNQSFDSVVIGKDASYYTQDLQNTVIIGSEAYFYGRGGVSSATARNGVVIGSGAMKGISTTDYVNDYGSVAIGYRAAFRNKSGTSYNVAIGLQSLYGFPPSFPSTTGLTGDNNVAIGRNSGYRIQSGSNNICVGYNAGDTSSPVTITSQSNYICLGNNSITNAYIRVAFTVTSDERDKAEIKPLGLGLDFINNLKPISFKFKKEVGEEYIKNEEGNEEELNPNYIPSRESTEVEQEQRYGFSAQDVSLLEGDEPVIVDNKNTEKLGLRTEVIIPILVKAIQELKAEIEILKNK